MRKNFLIPLLIGMVLFSAMPEVEAGRNVNRVALNGVGMNGPNLTGNGLSFNGLSFNGTSFNGTSFNGKTPQGTKLDTANALRPMRLMLPGGVDVILR